MCLWLSGDRTNVAGSDLSDTLPEEIEAEVKLAAEISMGTEVSEQDIGNIMHLCDQVCLFRPSSRDKASRNSRFHFTVGQLE